LEIKLYEGVPAKEIVDAILDVHKEVFEDETLPEKAATKQNVRFFVAWDNEKVAGYKIGYELSPDTFYSWYGAVRPEYRGQGIASTLMKQQHHYLKDAGYVMVETKTRNKWREMLILNIKHGFDVTETFFDGDGIHRIILRKQL